MIDIETPPRLKGEDTREIEQLRNYLYRTMNNLQQQLNLQEDRIAALENRIATIENQKKGE